MKKLALALAAVLLMSGCRHDVPEFVDLDRLNDTKSACGFTVLSENDFDAKSVDWNTYGFWEENGGTKATYTNLVSFATGFLSTMVAPRVHQVVGTYTSTDINGDPITVSGKIFYPKDGNIRNVIIASHYTIGSNAECPSESYSFEGIYAAYGYAVIVADYVGFGVTADTIHPYLQANTCAGNVLDMAEVAVPFLKARGLKIADDSVILLGYSQGGACTLHVQRLLEASIKYGGLFKIKKNYCGAGPYDIAMTYDFSIKKDKTGIPCAIPMIVQGMSIGMSKPLDMDYFFQEPLRSNYDEWLNSKKYTVTQISAMMGRDKLSEIMTPNGCDKSKPETARFYMELKSNSIPSDYFPKAPIFLFHSEDDQTVPFVNSQIIQRQIRGRIALNEIYPEKYNPDVEYDFGHYGNHQQGATEFFLKVLEKLK
ncbi:MAG: lipase family protein [Bacteroidia bacterium]|nr:lipase family protein [Bacteroidia bacterium]